MHDGTGDGGAVAVACSSVPSTVKPVVVPVLFPAHAGHPVGKPASYEWIARSWGQSGRPNFEPRLDVDCCAVHDRWELSVTGGTGNPAVLADHSFCAVDGFEKLFVGSMLEHTLGKNVSSSVLAQLSPAGLFFCPTIQNSDHCAICWPVPGDGALKKASRVAFGKSVAKGKWS